MILNEQQAAFVRSLADVDGYIEPDELTEVARDPACVLHGLYEWDQDKAAALHWREQSRSIIRLVRVEVKIDQETVLCPVYVPDPDRPPQSRRYIDLTIAGRNRENARLILSGEMERVMSAIHRATGVAAILGLSAQLEQMLVDAQELRQRALKRRRTKGGKQKQIKDGRRRRRPADDSARPHA